MNCVSSSLVRQVELALVAREFSQTFHRRCFFQLKFRELFAENVFSSQKCFSNEILKLFLVYFAGELSKQKFAPVGWFEALRGLFAHTHFNLIHASDECVWFRLLWNNFLNEGWKMANVSCADLPANYRRASSGVTNQKSSQCRPNDVIVIIHIQSPSPERRIHEKIMRFRLCRNRRRKN